MFIILGKFGHFGNWSGERRMVMASLSCCGVDCGTRGRHWGGRYAFWWRGPLQRVKGFFFFFFWVERLHRRTFITKMAKRTKIGRVAALDYRKGMRLFMDPKSARDNVGANERVDQFAKFEEVPRMVRRKEDRGIFSGRGRKKKERDVLFLKFTEGIVDWSWVSCVLFLPFLIHERAKVKRQLHRCTRSFSVRGKRWSIFTATWHRRHLKATSDKPKKLLRTDPPFSCANSKCVSQRSSSV